MSADNQPKRRKSELSDNDVDRLLYESFCVEGAFVPQTPDEVARAEGEVDEDRIELPAGLRDPLAILNGRPTPCAYRRPSHRPDPTTVENLACAARNGGEIPPEVQRTMDEDEKAAEQEPGSGAK